MLLESISITANMSKRTLTETRGMREGNVHIHIDVLVLVRIHCDERVLLDFYPEKVLYLIG